jgi:SAM-dependent methyltransferase
LLKQVLACPRCRGGVSFGDERITCDTCGARYPIVHGVPVMTQIGDCEKLPQPPLRDGYDPGPHRRTMGSLLAALPGRAAILDLGSGNMRLNLPEVIRVDFGLTDYVDLVADAHRLPFREAALDMVLSLSVLEHLRQPFEASDEMYRVLKPGGYIYHETNFVFPYHGYPHHYFNFSPQGLKEVFRKFRLLQQGIAAHQMPSVTLEAVTNTYVYTFLDLRPRARGLLRRIGDLAGLSALYALGRQALWRRFDEWFEDRAFVLAAGVYCYGIKQPAGHETVVPPEIVQAYQERSDLQQEFREPWDLSRADNVVTRVLRQDPDAAFRAGARYVEFDAMRRAQRGKGVSAIWAYLRGRRWRGA